MVTSPPELVHFLELVEQAFAHVSHTPSVETGVPASVALRKQLEQTRLQLRCALDETSRRLEWHHLNIAFYGETNAGKSTLVETLGILLDEPARRARSAAFRSGESPEINADGVSVGDGRSDFTRETAHLVGEIGGIKVTLFDVPGIEGAESLVADEILDAIAKAHVVFYVTGRPTPPQTGADDGRIGTLEKIRDHLRDEAEVWLLFNKRVASPKALDGEGLTSPEEDAALADADRYMGGVLGAAFRGHLTLAALPAFLASADCLVPDSDMARKREKFLRALPASVLLKRSGVEDFYQRLSRDIVPDADRKKERINMAKLGRCVVDEQGKLKDAVEEEGLRQTVIQFTQNVRMAEDEISTARRRVQVRFNRASKRISDDFFCNVRNGMEKYHADGMWMSFDSTVKDNLNLVVKSEEAGLGTALSQASEEIVSACQAEVETSIHRLGNQASGLKYSGSFTSMRVWSADFMKGHEIDTDSGVSWIGVASSILPVFFGPAGLIAMSVGIVSSTWKLLSPRHQEAEQRKAIAGILEKMEEVLDARLKEEFAPLVEKLENWMKSVEESLENAGKEGRQVLGDLEEVEGSLARIANRSG
ncbi:GTPase domain-containing protein [Acetobacter senegalensis]|uniref:GTPase domain-containing protein n=1 Tax=Acetobacter senegalensis TaxID=446692 RepID=UPI0026524C39|nr:GTPase domain-containing protein [Acetobacter senegalensis]MDN7351544.1 GTPase domain-containing protein [Acetobacter senegalensis]